MITFYPGPSKVYPRVADYAHEAIRKGVVSLNHRSPGFMAILKETIRLLHEKLEIPEDYHIAFVSSATECWEIIAQSMTVTTSLHLYKGAFGQKWMEYAYRIKPPIILGEADVLCIVQNETSNGSQVRMDSLADFRREFTGLIAVDATSSMAGIELDWGLADIWFASVQKCFGLPAGLGILVYSPKALERAQVIDDRQHYNSLLFIHENFAKGQTHYTPNGLDIYLLLCVLQQVPPIKEVAEMVRERAANWYQFFKEEQPHWELLIKDKKQQSDTVIAVQGSEAAVKAIKQAAQQQGIILGNGYGDWKANSFRIANFPAIEDGEIRKLKEFLRSWRPEAE